MRLCLRIWPVTALWIVMFGTATGHADVPRTTDGNAVLVGSAAAPVQLEIFCEPQCPHCAELESSSGDRIGGELASGRLAVTYRWLTFLDANRHNDTSARVANALFLAADPTTSPTAYQAFVQDLYRNQSHDGPTNADLAAMARESGIDNVVADRIVAGDSVIDPAAVNDANKARLVQLAPGNAGTPTVYDLSANKVLDAQDSAWLDASSS